MLAHDTSPSVAASSNDPLQHERPRILTDVAHGYSPASGGTPTPPGDASAAPWDVIGEFATTYTPDWLRLRAERYALQSVGRRWMPDHAIAYCHRLLASGATCVEVWRSLNRDGDGRANFHNLMTCQSPWADPICAGTIADARRGELCHALRVHRDSGGSVCLLTYTARHNASTALSAFLPAMLRARRAMRSPRSFALLRRRYGHVGSVTATEITLGERGYHPHFHELWFGDADVGDLGEEIGPRWLAALRSEGLDGLPGIASDVRDASMTVDEYVTKYGRERTWDADRELAKGNVKRGRAGNLKPFDLLHRGLVVDDPEHLAQARDRYREYVQATKGKSSLHWSPGLKGRMGVKELTDGEIADSHVDGPSVLLGRVELEDWRRIMAADARVAVLAAAATGEWLAVRAVIDALPTARPRPRRGSTQGVRHGIG